GERGFLSIDSGRRLSDGTIDHRSWTTSYFMWPDEARTAVGAALAQAGQGREVFFCAHLLTANRRGKENAAPVLKLYFDGDGATELDWLPATAVVESSPGRHHYYFRLTEPIAPAVAQQLNERLAARMGADRSGADLSQVLRVPETPNHKYPDATVRLLRLSGV